jgi:TP901 family phage tail tape measure protein
VAAVDEELKMQIKAYDEFTAIIGRFSSALEATEKAERAVTSATDAVNKAVDIMAKAIQKTGPPLSEAEKAARAKAAADKEAARAAKEHSERVDGLLQALGAMGILRAVQQGIEGVTSAGGQFDQNLRVLSGLTGEASGEAEAYIMALEGQRKGVTELSAGLNELARAGYDTKESLTGLDELAEFAGANFETMQRAAAPALVVLKTFELGMEDLGQVTDVFTEAANRTAMGFDDFQLSLGMSAAVGRMAGQEYQELIAVLSVLRDAGLGASDAGTSIKSAWLQLMNPTEEAKRVMRDLGIEVYDSQGKMKTWADVVAEFERAMAPLNDQSRNLAMTTILGSDGIRSMALSMQRGSDYIRGLTADLKASDGATAALSHQMGAGFTGAMERVQASAEKLRVTVFEDLENGALGLLDALDNLLVGFNSLPPAARGVLETLIGTAGLVAAVGAVALLVKSTAIPAIEGLVAILVKAGVVATGTGAAFTAMLGPIGLALAVIGAVAAGVIAYTGAQEKARAEEERRSSALVDLANRHRDLSVALDDVTKSDDEHARAAEDNKKVIKEIGDLMPELVSKWDAEGNAIELNTKALNANTEAARRNVAAKNERSLDSAYNDMNVALGKVQAIEREIRETKERIAQQYKVDVAAGVLSQDLASKSMADDFAILDASFAKQLSEAKKRYAEAAALVSKEAAKVYGATNDRPGTRDDAGDFQSRLGMGNPAGISFNTGAGSNTYDPKADPDSAEKARVAAIRDQMELLGHLITLEDERVDTAGEQLSWLRQIQSQYGDTRDLVEAIHQLEKEIAREPLQEQLAAFEKRKTLGEMTARQEQQFYENLVANAEQYKLSQAEIDEYTVRGTLAKREAEAEWRQDLLDTYRYNVDLTNASTAEQLSALKTLREIYAEGSKERKDLDLEVAKLERQLQAEQHDQKLAEIEFDSIVGRWSNERKLQALRDYLAAAKDLTIEQERELQQTIAQMEQSEERTRQDRLMDLYRDGLEAQRRISERRLRDEQQAAEEAKQREIDAEADRYESALAPLRLQLQVMQDQSKELERQNRLLEIQQRLNEKDQQIADAKAIRNRIVIEAGGGLLGFTVRRTYDEAKVRELEKERTDIANDLADEQARQQRERLQDSLQRTITAVEKERDAKLKGMQKELADMRTEHANQLTALSDYWSDRLSTQSIQQALEAEGWQTHYDDVLAKTQIWVNNMNAEWAKLQQPSLSLGADLANRLGVNGGSGAVTGVTGTSQVAAAARAPGPEQVTLINYGTNNYNGVDGVHAGMKAMAQGVIAGIRSKQ